MKPFDIRFFQDRKKILDLQLNPFTKLYHREKITPTPLSISHVASKHTHTHTQSTKFQILSGVSAEFHYHANSIDRYPRNKRGNVPPVLERLLRATAIFIHLPPTRPGSSTAIKQSVLARVLGRQENPLFLPPAVFLRCRARGKGVARPSWNACRRKLRHGLALRRTNRNGPGGGRRDGMRERDNDERESLLSGLVDNRSAAVSSASTTVQFRPSATGAAAARLPLLPSPSYVRPFVPG